MLNLRRRTPIKFSKICRSQLDNSTLLSATRVRRASLHSPAARGPRPKLCHPGTDGSPCRTPPKTPLSFRRSAQRQGGICCGRDRMVATGILPVSPKATHIEPSPGGTSENKPASSLAGEPAKQIRIPQGCLTRHQGVRFASRAWQDRALAEVAEIECIRSGTPPTNRAQTSVTLTDRLRIITARGTREADQGKPGNEPCGRRPASSEIYNLVSNRVGFPSSNRIGEGTGSLTNVFTSANAEQDSQKLKRSKVSTCCKRCGLRFGCC